MNTPACHTTACPFTLLIHRHGDAHVGFRDGDDSELTRWAAKQRSEHKAGQLAEAKQAQLAAVGFEFDGERAEWLRWFNEIQAFKARHGHCQPHPLAHPNGEPVGKQLLPPCPMLACFHARCQTGNLPLTLTSCPLLPFFLCPRRLPADKLGQRATYNEAVQRDARRARGCFG